MKSGFVASQFDAMLMILCARVCGGGVEVFGAPLVRGVALETLTY
jgi:hypothetical protein